MIIVAAILGRLHCCTAEKQKRRTAAKGKSKSKADDRAVDRVTPYQPGVRAERATPGQRPPYFNARGPAPSISWASRMRSSGFAGEHGSRSSMTRLVVDGNVPSPELATRSSRNGMCRKIANACANSIIGALASGEPHDRQNLDRVVPLIQSAAQSTLKLIVIVKSTFTRCPSMVVGRNRHFATASCAASPSVTLGASRTWP